MTKLIYFTNANVEAAVDSVAVDAKASVDAKADDVADVAASIDDVVANVAADFADVADVAANVSADIGNAVNATNAAIMLIMRTSFCCC